MRRVFQFGIACTALLTLLATRTPAEDAGAPATDRVGFPKDYRREFEMLRSADRPGPAQIATIYGNKPASSVTKTDELPYPYGSVIVMEITDALRDAAGKPQVDDQGRFRKGDIVKVHVMRREKGFGEAYSKNRTGEWEYVEYSKDGGYQTPPQKSASCAECHLKAGPERDFVYGARLSDHVKPLKGVAYGQAAGETLLLDAFIPPDKFPRPVPAVVLVHGGGWRSGGRDTSIVGPLALALAQEGIAAFSIDYRLVKSGADGQTLQNQFPAAWDDCQRAVRWVRRNAERFGIDPERIGATGHSAGGHLSSLLGTTDTRDNSDAQLAPFSSRVKAVVSLYGPQDLARSVSTVAGDGTPVQQIVDSFVGRDDSRRREASPRHHIDDRTAAFLIFHGTEDRTVPIEQSRDFYAALKAAHRDAEFIELTGEDHSIRQPENQALFRKKTLEFFLRKLGK